MRKKNFINRLNLLFKSVFVACFLLFTSSVSTIAQPYAQMSFTYDYWQSYGTGYSYDYYKVHVNFYSDAACTIPTTPPSVNINFKYISTDDCGIPQEWDYSDSVSQIESNFYGAPGYFTQPGLKTAVRYDLRPGSGYTVAPVSTVDAPSDCY